MTFDKREMHHRNKDAFGEALQAAFDAANGNPPEPEQEPEVKGPRRPKPVPEVGQPGMRDPALEKQIAAEEALSRVFGW